ncbi:MAG: glutamine synthetase family protein [Clostridia bacterium]|nr:glutamine synthetase family protein [Clostridia bacterium]
MFIKEDIIRLIRENDVKFIRLQFTDMNGCLKNIAITEPQLEKALDGKISFDGSAIDGFVNIEYSDMYLKPDLSSFAIFPWRPQQGKVARLICDVYMADGTPFKGDPRYALKREVKRAAEMGYRLDVGSECEFFLFHTDDMGKPTTMTHDEGGYFDLAPLDMGEDCRRDILQTLSGMSFEIESSHHEVAHGQHEIDFKYTDALKAADDIMTFKLVVKNIAYKHGLHASFMAKPLGGIAGSGMHINLSLMKNNKNVFSDKSGEMGLSETGRSFIAGILAHSNALTAVLNPTVNSYKRLVPGFDAPCYTSWSASNRSALIRIPAAGGRIELRSPDPTCNPYLAVACVLRAGLDGVEKNMTPPEPTAAAVFTLSDEERAAKKIERLPESLRDAVNALRQDEVISDALGEHISKQYIEYKNKEWEKFASHVTKWEIDEYLTKY